MLLLLSLSLLFYYYHYILKQANYAFLSLKCHPEDLDFGDVIVGGSVKKSIHLQNESDCGLHFELKIHEETEGAFGDIKYSDNESKGKDG